MKAGLKLAEITAFRVILNSASLTSLTHQTFLASLCWKKSAYFLLPERVIVATVGAFPPAIAHSPFPSRP